MFGYVLAYGMFQIIAVAVPELIGERIISILALNQVMRFMKFISVLLGISFGVASVGVVTTECHCIEKKACSRNCCCDGKSQCCCKTETKYSNVAAVGSIVKTPKNVRPVSFVSPAHSAQAFQSNAICIRISNLPLDFQPPALEAQRVIVLRI
jgi:hypothetical protein